MLADLKRLIRLQKLKNSAKNTRRAIEEIPIKLEALRTRINARNDAVIAAKECVTANHKSLLSIENNLAVLQQRLTKYKDQLMAVKTNKEYQAMQKEIEIAEQQASDFEDQILEQLVTNDTLTETVSRTERELESDEAAAKQEQLVLNKKREALEIELKNSSNNHSHLVSEIDLKVLELFESVAKRTGVAVSEARDGHCSFCNVRLRPQIVNEIRRSESLIQCDSCFRILYLEATHAKNSST